ncbi:MAG: alanine--tRNA ligase, partial [Gammaproteobacteria bacterium]|nr:alanine--tRNA ligase [Gammaproteobacteria bacterium]
LDMAGFDREMEAQRERARAASQFGSADTGDLQLSDVTEFVGYDSLEGESTIIGIIVDGAQVDQADAEQQALVVLDRTPFYAESGGQAGDIGQLIADGVVLNVTDTVKSGDAFLHQGQSVNGSLAVGDKVQSVVNQPVRDATRLNHSATHLMHAALRKILGEHVNQRGSLVNAERLRFDFSHFEPVSREQLRDIERLVNTEIRANSAIETAVMDLESARNKGAMALFGEKYSAEVRVLSMGDGFSVELCGGTHAARTGDIGIFRIVSEQGVASGVRRIEAITGSAALAQVESNEDLLSQAGSLVRADNHNLADKLRALIDQNKKLEKTIADLNRKLATGGVGPDIAESAIDLGGVKLVVSQLDGADPKSLPDVLDQLKNKIGSGIIVLGTVSEGKVGLIVGVTKDLTDRFHAGDLVNHVASQVGGKGGGRPDMARAGGSDPDSLPAALASVEQFARNLV